MILLTKSKCSRLFQINHFYCFIQRKQFCFQSNSSVGVDLSHTYNSIFLCKMNCTQHGIPRAGWYEWVCYLMHRSSFINDIVSNCQVVCLLVGFTIVLTFSISNTSSCYNYLLIHSLSPLHSC